MRGRSLASLVAQEAAKRLDADPSLATLAGREASKATAALRFRGVNERVARVGAEGGIVDRAWILSGPYETGKTWATLWRLDSEARRVKGGQFAIVRKVRNDMDGTVLATWRKILAMRGNDVRTFGGEKVQWYDYPNGSRVWVGGLDRPEKTLSGERDGVYVNQAEELDETDWELLTRSTTGRGAVTDTPMLFGDCNPGAEDHWIIRRAQAGTLTLLESRHEDNPRLFDETEPGVYVLTEAGRSAMRDLDGLTGVRYLRGRLGRWVGAEGAFFAQLDEARHLVEYRVAPEGWPVWAALDYGFAHLFSFGVLTVDPRGRVILLGRHAASRWYLPQHVEAMDGLLAALDVSKRGLRVVAGHDCWAAGHDEAETIAEKLRKHGYHLERATIARVPGARAVGERLGNPESDPPVEPTLFLNRLHGGKVVFDALARMVPDPRNPEDVRKIDADAAGRGGDDDYDMLRYGVMAAPSGAGVTRATPKANSWSTLR